MTGASKKEIYFETQNVSGGVSSIPKERGK